MRTAIILFFLTNLSFGEIAGMVSVSYPFGLTSAWNDISSEAAKAAGISSDKISKTYGWVPGISLIWASDKKFGNTSLLWGATGSWAYQWTSKIEGNGNYGIKVGWQTTMHEFALAPMLVTPGLWANEGHFGIAAGLALDLMKWKFDDNTLPLMGAPDQSGTSTLTYWNFYLKMIAGFSNQFGFQITMQPINDYNWLWTLGVYYAF